MARKNEYELIDDSVITDGAYIFEPYEDWKENLAFWISKYINAKCEDQSKRFVSEDDISKISNIGYLGTFGKNATKKFKDSLSFISQVPF